MTTKNLKRKIEKGIRKGRSKIAIPNLGKGVIYALR
jgi:hypothetical protein